MATNDNPVEIVTFGCRLNAYESEVMRAHALDAGLTNAIVFNTCAVTAEAERQARQAIRKARRDNPHAQIIVTGCAAQVNPDSFARMPEVSRVIGNMEKLEKRSFGIEATERVRVNDIMEARETASHLVDGFEGRARAFVQVQNGCDHRCTFCIIPYGRGNSRSVPMGEVARQLNALVDAGYGEVVLTGVDITSYGADLPGEPKLGQLVRRLLQAVPGLKRLRISSLDCIEMDDDLFRLFAEEERLMPHLHLSLQAGDDLILKRMKRRHLRDHAIALTERLRAARPDIVLGADLIAGFPTETEEMFANTMRIVAECGLTWLHVFPYSERPGTPAARIPNQVPKPVRKERAARLRALGVARETEFLASRIGKVEEVLVESGGLGRSAHFAPVALPAGLAEGSIHRLAVTGVAQGRLVTEQPAVGEAA